MAKYTVIGDPHARPDNLDKINTLFDIIEDMNHPCIILGDLLDTKEIVRGKCLNLYIERIKASKLHFTILVGNHDWFNHDCLAHSLEPLKLLLNVTLVDKPMDLKDFYAIPYVHDKQILSQNLASFVTRKPVVGHFDIVGFDYGNGHISEAGLVAKDLARFPVVLSGHYHKYQKQDNILYLGTPFSHSFGESNQQKYIGIFDSNSTKFELIPTTFSRHLTIELDCDTDDGSERARELFPNDYVRVILYGIQENINKFNREEGIKYIERPKNSEKHATISEIQSTEQQFVKWAKDLKGYSDSVVELGLEILRDV